MGSKQTKFEEDTMKEFEVSLWAECWSDTAVTVDSFQLIGSYSTKQSRNLSVSLLYCSACWK